MKTRVICGKTKPKAQKIVAIRALCGKNQLWLHIHTTHHKMYNYESPATLAIILYFGPWPFPAFAPFAGFFYLCKDVREVRRFMSTNNSFSSKMKKLLKRLLPDGLLRWYKSRNGYKNIAKFRTMSTKEVFTEVYNSKHWRSSESISGAGSEMKQTQSLVSDLDQLLKAMNIVSVLDLPCGDFNWMQHVDLSKIDYIGADIVDELIHRNIRRYSERENLTFKVLNLITDPLPKSDLIIVRDCLVHFSYIDIMNALQNIKLSGSKYLLTTTFTNHHLNQDIVTGDWRPLNLQEKPFHFPAPIVIINENCTEENGAYRDKSMALWEISKL